MHSQKKKKMKKVLSFQMRALVISHGGLRLSGAISLSELAGNSN